jgi:hypothetical protein
LSETVCSEWIGQIPVLKGLESVWNPMIMIINDIDDTDPACLDIIDLISIPDQIPDSPPAGMETFARWVGGLE